MRDKDQQQYKLLGPWIQVQGKIRAHVEEETSQQGHWSWESRPHGIIQFKNLLVGLAHSAL